MRLCKHLWTTHLADVRLCKHLLTTHLVDVTGPFFILGLNPKGLQSEDVLDYYPFDKEFSDKLREFPIKIVPTTIIQHETKDNLSVQIFAMETLRSHKKDLYSFITTNIKFHMLFLPAHHRSTDLLAWNNAIMAHSKMLQYTTYLKLSGPTIETMETIRPNILNVSGILGVYCQ